MSDVVAENEFLFLENIIWETDEIEINRFVHDEQRHVKGVVFKNTTTGEMLACTFKPHGIIPFVDPTKGE